MGIKSRQEYIESIQNQKPNVYLAGQKVKDLVENPYFRTALNRMGKTYDWANGTEYKDLVTFHSPLIGEKVSFWTSIPDNIEEQLIRVIKLLNARYLCCFCMMTTLATMLPITYEIEQKTGIPYYQRLLSFIKRIQKNDDRVCLGLIDPKGDRGLRPSQQSDPDLYLHVVDRQSDGIIVRGAKAHTTNAPCMNWFYAAPSRSFEEEEVDYAVSFATPVDTEGITYIVRPAAGPLEPTMDRPISSHLGDVECLSIFNDVFVPWENVFMCGEWEYTPRLIEYSAPYARLSKSACLSARTDLIIGAAALISEYNGVEKASHVRSKLTDMMIASEIGWGCAIAAARMSVKHPCGLPIPDAKMASAGCYHMRMELNKFLGTLMELGGGLVTTGPLEADFQNPETRDLILKYLKGKTGVSTEARFRALQLIHELTASDYSGYLRSSVLCAATTPETQRVDVYRNYDLKEKVEIAKTLSLQGLGD